MKNPYYKLTTDYIENVIGFVDNDLLYKDPYLFGFFSQEDKLENGLSPYLIGYTEIDGQVDIRTNDDGVLYLSNVGYFITSLLNTQLTVEKTGNKYKLYKDQVEIDFQFKNQLFTDYASIEVTLFQVEVIRSFLDNVDMVEMNTAKICTPDVILSELVKVNKALNYIQKVNKDYFETTESLINRIAFHDENRILASSSKAFYGAIFLGMDEENHVLHYVDLIVHETSHTLLNTIMWNVSDYVVIDPYEERFKSPFKSAENLRGIYFLMHSNFVLVRLIEFFISFYNKIEDYPMHYNEVVGRLIYYIELLEIAQSCIDDPSYFTPTGYQFYRTEVMLKFETYKSQVTDLVEKYEVPYPEDEKPFFKWVPKLELRKESTII